MKLRVGLRVHIDPKTGKAIPLPYSTKDEPLPIVDSAPDKPVNGGPPEKEPPKPKPS